MPLKDFNSSEIKEYLKQSMVVQTMFEVIEANRILQALKTPPLAVCVLLSGTFPIVPTTIIKTLSDNGRKALWKPQGDSGNSKPSGPWGSKR